MITFYFKRLVSVRGNFIIEIAYIYTVIFELLFLVKIINHVGDYINQILNEIEFYNLVYKHFKDYMIIF